MTHSLPRRDDRFARSGRDDGPRIGYHLAATIGTDLSHETDPLDELLVGRILTSSLNPRFETERTPDLRHALALDPVLGSKRPRRPMRRILLFSLQRLDNGCIDDVVADRSCRTGPRGVTQPVQPVSAKRLRRIASRHVV